MSVVSILGAGEIGAATAYALARRSRVGEVRLVDTAAGPAAGKALDMRQSGPNDRFDTPITSRGDVPDAVNADVIVIADAFADGEWEGERGLALIKLLLRAGTKAPIVCAGQKLVDGSGREKLGCPPTGSSARLVGRSRVRVGGAELTGAGADVSIALVGCAPRFTIGWTSATFAGSTLTGRLCRTDGRDSDLVKKTLATKARPSAPPRPSRRSFNGPRRHLFDGASTASTAARHRGYDAAGVETGASSTHAVARRRSASVFNGLALFLIIATTLTDRPLRRSVSFHRGKYAKS